MQPCSAHDSLYLAPRQDVPGFEFDAAVARVFPDMIRRSVPGYGTVISLTGVLAAQYVQPETFCYDLGCSLGAAVFSMARHIQQPGCRIIAVDKSTAMVERCKEILQEARPQVPVDLLCADAKDLTIQRASVVVLNFTLQFIERRHRIELLEKLYEGLLPGGALIVSEKITFSDPRQAQRITELHHAFKRAEGYSDLEISQKRTALERVLFPETIAEHVERLTGVGFSSCEVWFQCLNFMSLLALK